MGGEALALQIARWTSDVGGAELPPQQLDLARLRVLDCLGLVLAARSTKPGRTILQFVENQAGTPQSTVVGSQGQLPATWGALAHGALAHALDFDDTFLDSIVHPGSVIVPTALAAGEATRADGEEILAAIVIGYEVAARLGAPAARALHSLGFHPSAVIGPLAGAVTAARLYKLGVAETASAIGIAGSMSGGLMEFLSDGSWTKCLHLGWAAHGGLVAAQLAGAGFRGPASVLEGSAGLYRAFLRNPALDLSTVVAGLGRTWHGAAAQFKYYPCAHVIQPYIDAALRLRSCHQFHSSEIFRVHCRVPPWAVPIVCEPRPLRVRPPTAQHAIAGLPYLVAAALAEGSVTLDTHSPARLQDTSILELAERVFHVEDVSLTASFHGDLEIHLRDGSVLAASAEVGPVDAAKLRDKFRSNAARSCEASRVEMLEAACMDSFEPAQIVAQLSAITLSSIQR